MRYDKRIAARREKGYRESGSFGRSTEKGKAPRREPPTHHNTWRIFNDDDARAALCCAYRNGRHRLGAPALAQNKTVKIGVPNDMSSLYADTGRGNSPGALNEGGA